MNNVLPVVVRILFSTLVLSVLVGIPGAWSQQRDKSSARLSAMLRDAETATGLVMNGKLFYDADSEKKTWGNYCRQSVQLANRGEFRAALREASKALFLGQTSNNTEALSYATRDLAYAYSLAGDMDRAENFAKQALIHLERSSTRNRRDILSFTHKILGDIAMRRNEPEKAAKHLEAALSETYPNSNNFVPIKISMINAEIHRKQFDAARRLIEEIGSEAGRWAPLVQRAQGQLNLAEQNYPKAIEHYSKAAAGLSGEKNIYHRMWAQYGLASAYMGAGDRDKALFALSAALSTARALRIQFHSEEFRAGFFGDVQSIYDDAIDLLAGAGRHTEALALSEESRARALLDILRGRAKDDALDTERAISMVQEGTVVVVYHTLADRTIAWTIRRSGITATAIPLGRKELNAAAGRFRLAMSGRAHDVKTQARALYASLIQPMNLTAGETLIVVPHRSLHFVPMPALMGPQGYLVEERPVVTVPSLNAMLVIEGGDNAARQSMFAIGNPDLGDATLSLPGAEREVVEIGGLFPASKVFIRAEASKQKFVVQAPGNDMIHVAAHTTVDEIDPLYSTIKLAGSAVARGDLEAHEVLKLDLSAARLVTLSACESGLGKISGGDEFYGFQRTFLAAGAKTLVLTLWPVEDESTAQLMNTFYKGLQNQSAVQALRHAQLALLKSPVYADPAFWAPFVLIGNWK